MKEYDLGDRITLEVQKASDRCVGCFFLTLDINGCDILCGGIDSNLIIAEVDQ